MRFSYFARSVGDTVELGKKVGSVLRRGDIVAYLGGLGAGKTTMTHGIAVGMGLKDEVCSPTFAIVNEYLGKLSMCHFDMYRISGEHDLDSVGFFDYLLRDCVIVIEWSENIAEVLPPETVFITINVADENSREIIIEGDERFDFS